MFRKMAIILLRLQLSPNILIDETKNNEREFLPKKTTNNQTFLRLLNFSIMFWFKKKNETHKTVE